MEQLGKYEILGRIGEGGFGTVWKGRDPFLKRTVAIKTCTSENDELRKRFLREAEIAGGLHHVNVTLVHDFGYHDGVPFLVQEFLTGEDLSSIIRRKDAVPQATKLRWLVDVARGLEYAHGKGVVHRDVKPANVRIIDGGTAKVMDFGIAKLAEMNTNQLTKTGTAMGTIGYMAPEQVNGQPVDHRADIFAYGVMAYELLTYERPFEADTMSRVFYRILHEEPKPISQLIPLFPADLERVVLRCLAKDPHHRYGSFRAVLADLERIVEGRPIEDVPEGDATAIDNPAFRPTELVDAAPRPSGPTRIVTAGTGATRAVPPTGPTAMVGTPNTATGYAPPSGRKLSTALIAAAVIGGVIAGSAVLLVGGKQEPETAAASAAPAPVEPAADPAEGRERARVLVAEAERLISEGRRSAALEVAIDAVSLDPESERARDLIEELAEEAPARAAAAPSAPVPSAPSPRPTTVTAVPAPSPTSNPPAPTTPAYAPAPAAPVATAPTPAPVVPNPAPAPAPTAYAPTPAPAPAPAADPTAAAEVAVRDLLARYANAYERLDAGAVAALWPTIGAERQRGLTQAFANYKWLEMDLDGCAIALSGDTATADCRMRQTYELKVGKAEPRDAAVRFKLRKSGGAWAIDDVGSR